MTTSKGPSFKELNIIRDNYKQIASSLTSNEGCRRIVLDELYSQKIISEEQHISISNKERFQGAQHSTNDLLHEVIQFVKISPNRFIEVLEIMEKEAVLRNTVKSMKFQLNTVPHIMNGKRPPVIAPKPTRAKSVGVLPKVVPLHSRPRTQSTKVPYIHEQSDVTAKAQLLKSQFTALIVSIKNSPESDEIHIADLKRHIQVFLGCTFDNVSAGLQKHINCIEQIESIPEILDYLQQNNFLGYFNSCLLEEVASLLEDRFVSQEIEKYKDMRTTFLMEATFSRILQLFEEHPDLVPTVAVEFPTVVFEVNTLSWSDKAIFSCTIYFDNCFSWIRASALKVDKQERLRLVYAVPPRVYNAAASSLKKVSVLQELTTMQITVTDVPDITFCESDEPMSSPNSQVMLKDVESISDVDQEDFDDYDDVYFSEVIYPSLHEAAIAGHATSIQLLVRQGSNVNALWKYRNTPLHKASQFGNAAAIEMLIICGANIYAVNEFGKTPLDEAKINKKAKAIRALTASIKDYK